MSDKVWNRFSNDVKGIIPTIDTTVLNKLKTTFFDMPKDYHVSQKCITLLSETLKKISDNRLKVYIHLLEFKRCLKAAKKVKRKNETSVEVESKRTKNISEEYKASNNNEIVHNIVDNDANDDTNVTRDTDTEIKNLQSQCEKYLNNLQDNSKIEKYIEKLENLLRITKEQIEKLEEQELSLDDLNNEMNAFIMLDKLKIHYVKVWKKISKLRNTKSNLHKKYLNSFTFSGSMYEDLNREIEKFVRLKKFPDYHDIRLLVTEYVHKHNLKFSNQKISELSIDIFTQIVNQLKKLRITNFIQYFGNHLTDQVKPEEDPVIRNEDLRRTLYNSKILGERKMDTMMEEYSRRQQEQQLSNDAANAGSENDISTEHSCQSDNEDLDDEKCSEQFFSPIEYTINGHASGNEIALRGSNLEELMLKTNSESIETKSMFFINKESLDQIMDKKPINKLKENLTGIKIPDTMEKPSEEFIQEISSTTFQFNVDQMKQGETSQMYSDIVIINSDEEVSDSLSSDESSDSSLNINNFQYTYSSKLDDFLVIKPDSKRSKKKDIVIHLDDDDDDDVVEIQIENINEDNSKK